MVPCAIVAANKLDANNPLVKNEHKGKWAYLPVENHGQEPKIQSSFANRRR
jgi:hypothetical protein